MEAETFVQLADTGYSSQSFEREFTGPVEPAPQAGDFNGLPDDADMPQQPGAAPVMEEAPIFPGTPAPGAKEAVKAIPFDTVLKVRDMMQSQLMAKLAKSPNADRYKMSPEDFELLADVYAPYIDAINGTIPPWIMIIIAEAYITGSKVISALEERKVNVRNAKAVASTATAQTLQQATAREAREEATGTRKRFQVHANGFYRHDRAGNYVGIDDATEKADLKDIDDLIQANGAKKIQRIFNLPELPSISAEYYERQAD